MKRIYIVSKWTFAVIGEDERSEVCCLKAFDTREKAINYIRDLVKEDQEWCDGLEIEGDDHFWGIKDDLENNLREGQYVGSYKHWFDTVAYSYKEVELV